MRWMVPPISDLPRLCTAATDSPPGPSMDHQWRRKVSPPACHNTGPPTKSRFHTNVYTKAYAVVTEIFVSEIFRVFNFRMDYFRNPIQLRK